MSLLLNASPLQLATCTVPRAEACVCTAYYRGAMGIVVVYDVTDEASFNNIRNWMRNIEQHASETNSNKVRSLGVRCLPGRTGLSKLGAGACGQQVRHG